MTQEPRAVDVGIDHDSAETSSTRRRLLRWASGGAGLIALSASGAVALRNAVASDDDDDDSSGSGSDGGDEDNSGSGSDGDRDDDHSGHGGGGDEGDDRDDDDDEVVVTDAVPEGAVEVRIISDDAGGFAPGELTVDAGATVAFVNGHDDPHTATGAGFDTGVMQPGEVATVVLDEPGTFFYACQIHPEMTGSIVVRGDATPEASPEGSPEASPEASPVADEPSAEATVVIKGFAYDPPTLSVSVGTTVTWENADPAPHTASGEDDSFGTGQIDPGASGSATFQEAGTFPYVCAFHPDMTGTITVE